MNMIHTDDGENIAKFRSEADKFPMTEVSAFGETGYTLLKVDDPGEPAVRRRECAARWRTRTDEQALIDKLGAGINKVASGPFSPTQVGYLPDTGYPLKQDMAKAQELVKSYKADHPGPLNINLSTTQDARPHSSSPRPSRSSSSRPASTTCRSARSSRRSTSSRRCKVTSRPSSGATTAGSTSTPSTSGGRPRTRCRGSARAELRAHQGPGDRQGARPTTAGPPTRR